MVTGHNGVWLRTAHRHVETMTSDHIDENVIAHLLPVEVMIVWVCHREVKHVIINLVQFQVRFKSHHFEVKVFLLKLSVGVHL